MPKGMQLLLALRWALAAQAPREMGPMMPELDRLCERTAAALGSDELPFSDPKFQPVASDRS
jgi:hypothetical protein